MKKEYIVYEMHDDEDPEEKVIQCFVSIRLITLIDRLLRLSNLIEERKAKGKNTGVEMKSFYALYDLIIETFDKE